MDSAAVAAKWVSAANTTEYVVVVRGNVVLGEWRREGVATHAKVDGVAVEAHQRW